MRILLVDDHALCRCALSDLLSGHSFEVKTSGGQEDVVELARQFQPRLILLDLRMPGLGGLEILRRLHKAMPDTPVVILTFSAEERDLFDCLRAGARGYLVKDAEPAYLLSAIKQVAQGKLAVAPSLTETLARALSPDASAEDVPPDPFCSLTPRERDILGRLAEGESNKVIAKRLGISDGTVKLHVKAVLRKLGVHSRVAAAVKAVDLGLTREHG